MFGGNMDNINRVAFMYDFDCTLSPGYMFDFGFLKSFNQDAEKFWKDNQYLSKLHNMDNNLGYLYLLIEYAKQNNIKLTNDYIKSYGENITFFNGLDTWFDKINEYGASLGLKVEHYIISSGLKELIAGTSIAPKIKRIFATNFAYDKNGEAMWPAQVVNYTTKTQYIFRVKKNLIDNLYNQAEVNEFMDKDKKMPYKNMFYFGDGETDIPCMKLVKDKGGHSICVYDETKPWCKEIAQKIYNEGRVNIFAKADYSEDSELFKEIKNMLKEIANQSN